MNNKNETFPPQSEQPVFRATKGIDYDGRVLSVEEIVDEKLPLNEFSLSVRYPVLARYDLSRLSHTGGLVAFRSGGKELREDVESAERADKIAKDGYDHADLMDIDFLDSRVRRDEFTHQAIKERREELGRELERRKGIKARLLRGKKAGDQEGPILEELEALDRYENILPSEERIRKVAAHVLEQFGDRLHDQASLQARLAGVDIVKDDE